MKKNKIVEAAIKHKKKIVRKINKNGSKFSLPPLDSDDGRKYMAWETEDDAFIAGALWALKQVNVPVEK